MSNLELYQGNCLELMSDIADNSIDCIICDLPYGTTSCKWDSVLPFDVMWAHYNRIIKDDGAIVLFSSQPFTSMLVSSNLKNFKYEWIWEKQKACNFMSAKYMPLKYHENIMVFSKNNSTKAIKYNPQRYKVLELDDILAMTKVQLKQLFESRDYDRYGKVDRRKTINNPTTNKELIGSTVNRIRNQDDGYRFPKSVLKINKSVNKNLHPTQKPVELLEYLVKTYTDVRDVVLDNCMGSGTTGVACKNLDRDFIGIELNEDYFNIAYDRILN